MAEHDGRLHEVLGAYVREWGHDHGRKWQFANLTAGLIINFHAPKRTEGISRLIPAGANSERVCGGDGENADCSLRCLR